MKTIEQYCQSITKKTLFIFCNDCQAMPQFVSRTNFTVATAFANLVSPKNGFDEAWFKYHLKTNKVEQVIIAGHDNCSLIPFLLNDTSDNVHWTQVKHELLELEKLMGNFSSMDVVSKNKFMRYHIALQVKWVHEFLQKTGVLEMFNISVGGIVIDENRNTVLTLTDAAVLLLTQPIN